MCSGVQTEMPKGWQVHRARPVPLPRGLRRRLLRIASPAPQATDDDDDDDVYDDVDDDASAGAVQKVQVVASQEKPRPVAAAAAFHIGQHVVKCGAHRFPVRYLKEPNETYLNTLPPSRI